MLKVNIHYKYDQTIGITINKLYKPLSTKLLLSKLYSKYIENWDIYKMLLETYMV